LEDKLGEKFKKLTVMVNVLQTTQSLVISHCFAEDSKEMFKDFTQEQSLFCSLNLLYGGVPVVVVVFSSSLLTNKTC